MARRRRYGRKRSGKKSKSVAILPLFGGLAPAYMAYNAVGLTKTLPIAILQQYTGYNPDTGDWNSKFPIRAGGMMILGMVGHKIAAKTVNKYIRKATMGWVVL